MGKNKKASPIWKCIFSNKNFLLKKFNWVVGNGKDISFWDDKWVGHSLLNSGTSVRWGDPRVSEFIDHNGTWDLKSIANVVPRDKIDEISNIPLPISTSLEDFVAWEGNGARTFSVGNYYQLIIKDKMDGMVN